MTTPVYKLLTLDDWTAAEAAGRTMTALDEADGYVHLSTPAQVKETARRHFAGKVQVKLLQFNAEALGDVRWEPSRGGDLFPHLYGTLRIAEASAAWWLERDANGELIFPEGV